VTEVSENCRDEEFRHYYCTPKRHCCEEFEEDYLAGRAACIEKFLKLSFVKLEKKAGYLREIF